MIIFLCIILVLSFTTLSLTIAYFTDVMARLLNSLTTTAVGGYGSVISVTEALDYIEYYVSIKIYQLIKRLKQLFLKFNCCGIEKNNDIHTNGTFPSSCCNSV